MRMPDHQRSKRIWFHDLGIWGYDVINDEGWKLKSLSSIKRMLGHEEVQSNPKCIAIVRGNHTVNCAFSANHWLSQDRRRRRRVASPERNAGNKLHKQRQTNDLRNPHANSPSASDDVSAPAAGAARSTASAVASWFPFVSHEYKWVLQSFCSSDDDQSATAVLRGALLRQPSLCWRLHSVSYRISIVY